MSGVLRAVPLSLREANEFVRLHHRHHGTYILEDERGVSVKDRHPTGPKQLFELAG